MSKYTSINNLAKDINILELPFKEALIELFPLLELLEKTNPCNQQYEIINKNVVISYSMKLNLFNFSNISPLRVPVKIIGLPISICISGYLGDNNEVQNIINQKSGLKVLLNSDLMFKGGGNTLSTFIFENSFLSFSSYLNSLRSSYRRRIMQALNKRDLLYIRRFPKENFTQEHYELYKSIMYRTSNPLETLSIDFFKEYDAELYEFIDKITNEVIGFIQIKEINKKLYFLFGGFRREDAIKYDIYYNMLLKIVEIGIEKNVSEIEFGQTAEESKLKIGCKEKYKYLYVHHSNLIINFFIRLLLPLFTYKVYKTKHHVFKRANEDEL